MKLSSILKSLIFAIFIGLSSLSYAAPGWGSWADNTTGFLNSIVLGFIYMLIVVSAVWFFFSGLVKWREHRKNPHATYISDVIVRFVFSGFLVFLIFFPCMVNTSLPWSACMHS
jgi:hypothetical protein